MIRTAAFVSLIWCSVAHRSKQVHTSRGIVVRERRRSERLHMPYVSRVRYRPQSLCAFSFTFSFRTHARVQMHLPDALRCPYSTPKRDTSQPRNPTRLVPTPERGNKTATLNRLIVLDLHTECKQQQAASSQELGVFAGEDIING